MTGVPAGWVELPEAKLFARGIRTARADVAFWKHLFESFEDVAIVRTAANDGDDAIVALVAPYDSVSEAEAILADVVGRGAPRVEQADLPAGCREDWFLAEWSGD